MVDAFVPMIEPDRVSALESCDAGDQVGRGRLNHQIRNRFDLSNHDLRHSLHTRSGRWNGIGVKVGSYARDHEFVGRCGAQARCPTPAGMQHVP